MTTEIYHFLITFFSSLRIFFVVIYDNVKHEKRRQLLKLRNQHPDLVGLKIKTKKRHQCYQKLHYCIVLN